MEMTCSRSDSKNLMYIRNNLGLLYKTSELIIREKESYFFLMLRFVINPNSIS